MTAPNVPIGDVVQSRTGIFDPRTASSAEFTYVDIAAVDSELKCISSARMLPVAEAPSRARKLIRAGDVLVSTVRPNLNAVAMVPADLDGQVASTGFCVLRASERVLPRYLFFFARSPTFVAELTALVSGALYPAVSDSQVLAQRLPLPNLREQERQVDVLSRAEGILRLRREAQRKAAELIPALFLDRFGDPASNPKGWRVEDLSDLLSAPIRNGVSPSKSGTTPGRVLTLAAITRGAFDAAMVKECKFANAVAKSDEVSVEDFLVCRGNGNADLVGVGCYPQANMPGVAFPDTMMAVRVQRDRVNPDYLAAHWATHFMRQQIKAISKTTNGTLKINQRGVGALRIQVPPFHLQTRFSEHVQSIRALMVQSEIALKTAQATFDALLHQAFPAT